MATSKHEGGLYMLEHGNQAFISILAKKSQCASLDLWHARLGHVNPSIISLLNKKCHLSLTSLFPFLHMCSTCKLSKSHPLPFSSNDSRTDSMLSLIHYDIWGPSHVKSNKGFVYYVLFMDAHSRFTWLYPMKLKSDFFEIFLHFQRFVENQLSTKIKIFQSDGRANSPVIVFNLTFRIMAFIIKYHVLTLNLKMGMLNANTVM